MQQQPSVPGNRRPVQQPIPEPPQKRRKKKSFMQSFMDNYIPSKKDSKRDLIRKCVLILAVVILLGSLVYIASYYGESSNNKERTGALADLFSGTGKDADYKVSSEYEKKGYLKKFWPLYELNEDIAGWIEIEGTQVNYAVVQGEDNKFYERRDFDRKDNQHGIPFADFRVDLKKPSTNTVIYAHNMNDGQMFGELLNYKSLAYYQEHPIVNFDSVYAEGEYKIAAIVLCKKDDPEYNYHNFIEAKTGADMDTFMKKTRERSLINTSVDVKEGDSLITLSTCDYSFKDPVTNDRIARFVVIARKVREGESSKVDTSGAKLNPNPLLPPEWATYLKKQQATELKRQEEAAAKDQYADIRKEAAKWFTANELSSIADEKLEAEIAARKELMSAYLSADELENLSAKEKLALLKERQDGSSLVDIALETIRGRSDLQWMTEDEMFTFAQQLAKYNKERWEKLMNEKAQEAGNVEISLSDSNLMGVAGSGTYQMSVSVEGSSESPRWRSDNKSVATVDQNGVVTFLKSGTATITVTVGGRTVSCVVTVQGEEPESKPESSKPESSESELSKPESSKPESSKPESSKPESSKPESSKPESSKPESSKPESSKPESSKPESSKPESSKPESSKPESSKPESSKPEPPEPEPSEPEPSEPEPSKPEEVSSESSVTPPLASGAEETPPPENAVDPGTTTTTP